MIDFLGWKVNNRLTWNKNLCQFNHRPFLFQKPIFSGLKIKTLHHQPLSNPLASMSHVTCHSSKYSMVWGPRPQSAASFMYRHLDMFNLRRPMPPYCLFRLCQVIHGWSAPERTFSDGLRVICSSFGDCSSLSSHSFTLFDDQLLSSCSTEERKVLCDLRCEGNNGVGVFHPLIV